MTNCPPLAGTYLPIPSPGGVLLHPATTFMFPLVVLSRLISVRHCPGLLPLNSYFWKKIQQKKRKVVLDKFINLGLTTDNQMLSLGNNIFSDCDVWSQAWSPYYQLSPWPSQLDLFGCLPTVYEMEWRLCG